MTVVAMNRSALSRYETLPYRVYDKMQRVNQAEIAENKRLGAALAMAAAIQAVTPHHRQRNNNAPARDSRSVGISAPPRRPSQGSTDEPSVPLNWNGSGATQPAGHSPTRSRRGCRERGHRAQQPKILFNHSGIAAPRAPAPRLRRGDAGEAPALARSHRHSADAHVADVHHVAPARRYSPARRSPVRAYRW